MNKSTKRLSLLFVSLIASSTMFFSCTDVDKTLGVGFIPDGEQRKFDTVTIYPDAYMVTMDSVYTSTATTFMVGSYFDPIFGQVTSGSVFQVLPSYDSMSFGTNPTYESLILRLTLNNSPLGDENIAQKISVYELTERIYYDSAYFACTPPMIGENPVAIASTTYNGEDTLNIELGATFANKLLNAPASAMAYNKDTTYNSPFFDYMKGFYIVAEPITGSTGRMNYFSPSAELFLTYSNVDTANVTRVYNNVYSYDSYGNMYYYAQFNTVDRKYSLATSPDSIPSIKLNDTTANGLNDKLYIQGFFGSTPYIKIKAEKLNHWLDSVQLNVSQASIVRAELVMELDDEFSDFDITKYPSALGGMTLLNPLVTYSAYYGNMYHSGYLRSFYYALSSFDGGLNTSLKKYSFNITHEVLEQLRKKTDLEFYLAPYTSNSKDPAYNTLLYALDPNQLKAYKAIVGGTTHATKPLKLMITYAKPY